MYPVSSAYTTAIQASRRILDKSVTVGGTTYSGSRVRNLTLHESVSDNSDRRLPGVAACASIRTSIVGSISESLVGTEMTAKSIVTLADGTSVSVPLGVFVIQDIQRAPGTNVTQIWGYDRMCLLDGTDFVHKLDDVTVSPVWTSFYDLLNAIVPYDNSGDIKWATVPEVVSTTVRIPLDELHGYNRKELIAYIAGAHGCFARFTRGGNLEFAWYANSNLTIPSKAIHMGGLILKSASDVTDEVSIYSNDDVSVYGYGDYTNDLISGLFAYVVENPSSTASPGSLTYRGDPSIQAGDIVTVTLRNGSTRRFAVSAHTLTFSGGLSGTVESHGLARKTFHTLDATHREIQRLKKVYAIVEEPNEDDSTSDSEELTTEVTE